MAELNKSESNSSDTEEVITVDSDSEWETASEDEEAADAVYQFKITLKHIKPPIWRRILVLNTSTFEELHVAVIDSMGWMDTHMHEFQGRGLEIGPANEEDPSTALQFMLFLGGSRQSKKRDETKVKVCDYFKKPKDSINFMYDFGDGWSHNIVLEKILPLDNRSYPICIAGKRACPPDDCGGVHGYERLLEILSNPNDPEHMDMKEWMNTMGKEDFNPEAFDPESVW